MHPLVTLRMTKSQYSQWNCPPQTARLVRTVTQADLASTQVAATFITKTLTHDSLQSPIPRRQSNKEAHPCRPP